MTTLPLFMKAIPVNKPKDLSTVNLHLDGDWHIANGYVNTMVNAVFDYEGYLVGKQVFLVRARRFDPEQSGEPSAQIQLWSNGKLISKSKKLPVTGNGQTLRYEWDAIKGEIECVVIGFNSGGSQTHINSMDIGQIEWECSYSTDPLPVYETINASWSVRENVSNKSAYIWAVSMCTSGSLESAWNTSKSVLNSIVSKWDIKSLLGLKTQYGWNIREIVGTNLTSAWNLIVNTHPVRGSIKIAYNVRRRIMNSFGSEWDVNPSLSLSLGF